MTLLRAVAHAALPAGTRVLRDQASSAPMPMPMAVPLERWNATLSLEYARSGARTRLVRNEHCGPLVVQRALHPEGDAVCQTIVVHPPGGIAGGDRLSIDVRARNGAFAQLTTPGATKWYKSNGRLATQDVRIDVEAGGCVEWLPLENIVYDAAHAQSALHVDVHRDASAAGWDITAYGRTASGERFARGQFRQSIELRREGRLLFADTAAVEGGDPLFDSPVGFGGRTVAGMLWAIRRGSGSSEARSGNDSAGSNSETRASSSDGHAECIDALRASDRSHAVTSLPNGVVLVRCLGDSTERVRDALCRAWTVLRPVYGGRDATVPRLWMT